MKISIAVPVFEYYGRGIEVLDDMFRTISYQTFKDVEVVISDHSVDDNIENFCKENEYGLNIKYIRNQNDRGDPASNTNNAINNCCGEIIKIFQQDDFFYDTEALEKMYKSMNESSKKWFVCGTIHTRDDGDTFFHPIYPRWDEKIILENNHNFIGGVSVLSIKNDVEIRFDSNVQIFLDVDFYYNAMINYGNPIFYNDILIANRCREDSDSLTANLCEKDKYGNVNYIETLLNKELNYLHKKYNIIK